VLIPSQIITQTLRQIASTAAGVAVGSTMGHGLSNMLFGGGSAAVPAEPVQDQSFEQRRMGGSCEIQAKGKVLSCDHEILDDTIVNFF
jgi:hypothetical protein